MPTIAQVAARAGVSVATVSRVVNATATVTAPTQARVVAAMDELAYRPNLRARNLSLGRNTTIAVVAPVPISAPAAAQLGGVAEEIADSGYELALVGLAAGSPLAPMIEDMAARRHAAGVLVLGARIRAADQALLAGAAFPIVVLGADERAHNRVLVDTDALGGQAVAQLRRLGHRRIALVSDGRDAAVDSGIRRALNGGSNGTVVRRTHPERAVSLLTGRAAPTAVIATSEPAVMAVLATARALGWRVPQDLSLMRCGPTMVATSHVSAVTAPLRRLGTVGANILLQLVRRGLGDARGIEAVVGPVAVPGSTVAPPAA